MYKKITLFCTICFLATLGAKTQNNTSDEGVVINGITWATRNVDAPGTFAVNPEDAGMFYQWNTNLGWSSTNPRVDSNGESGAWPGNASGTEWDMTNNNPCPAGWRVPTNAELNSLVASGSQWVANWNGTGVNGRVFGSGDNTIFLPAVGFRFEGNGSLGDVNSSGFYWSSRAPENSTTFAWNLFFRSGSVFVVDNRRAEAYSIRCVVDGVFINETNFPDPNFRAVVSGLVDGRDVITDAEIASIRTISASGQNISDLTGINFFTNLTHLSVWNNQLTSLDISSLTNLRNLDLVNNQLTSLDVSGLTNLAGLWIGFNRLTSLDVSNLTNLTGLDVWGNQLTSLNVSNLTNLTGLWAHTNQFTTLDVSNLTNLTNLVVHSNQLTSLDVSNLTNLTRLEVQNNQLTSTDLTGLDNLTIFRGENQTPTLTLTGADNNYSIEIELNNPTELVSGLSYFNGILTSTSNLITSSPFVVETGHSNPDFRLSGTLTLIYPAETSIPEINLNRTPVAFYTITGVRLGQKPQSGIFIILYDDGTAERVMR